MSYRTNDGKVMHSDDPREIVDELRAISFSPGANVREFMRQTAERAAMQTGSPIRFTDAAGFVSELVRVGLLLDEDAADPLYPEK